MNAAQQVKSAHLLRCGVVVHTDAEAHEIRAESNLMGVKTPRIVMRKLPKGEEAK